MMPHYFMGRRGSYGFGGGSGHRQERHERVRRIRKEEAARWMQLVLHGHEGPGGDLLVVDEPTLVRLMPVPSEEDIAKCLHELWADQMAALLASGRYMDDGSLVLGKGHVAALRALQTKPYEKQPKALRERTLSLVRLRLEPVMLACESLRKVWGLLEGCEQLLDSFATGNEEAGLLSGLRQLFARRMQFGMVLDKNLFVRSVSLLRDSEDQDGA